MGLVQMVLELSDGPLTLFILVELSRLLQDLKEWKI